MLVVKFSHGEPVTVLNGAVAKGETNDSSQLYGGRLHRDDHFGDCDWLQLPQPSHGLIYPLAAAFLSSKFIETYRGGSSSTVPGTQLLKRGMWCLGLIVQNLPAIDDALGFLIVGRGFVWQI